MNVLLIVCDTLGADHLGCYGYFRDTSPNIDRIASEGVIFEDFYNAGSQRGLALLPSLRVYTLFITSSTNL